MSLDTSKTITTIGRYEVVRRIADGGMGTVYEARPPGADRSVAIKVLSTAVRNPTVLERFYQEFRAASRVDHPNIVKAIEYATENDTPYLVMEYVDGESLGQKIEREGRIPEPEALNLIQQVCDGVHYAHQMGLIHRDIKPDNVLLTQDGKAKITDLGLVKNLDDEMNLTRTGRGLGTPHFMAPEQFRNAKNVDQRCDVYSIGATLYAMVTGETPFDKCGPLDCWMKKVNNEITRPRKLVPSLSDRVDWAIRRSMSGEPGNRPGNCQEFLEDLFGRSGSSYGPANGTPAAGLVDLWYLAYKDDGGETHTVKGNTEAIRRAISEGYLGDASQVRACKSKQGPFRLLIHFPEFRDLLVEPAPMRPTLPASKTPTPLSNTQLPPKSLDLSDSGAATEGRTSAPVTGRMPMVTDNPELAGRLPHIHIPEPEPAESGGSDWMTWAVVLVLAIASGIVGFMVLQN